MTTVETIHGDRPVSTVSDSDTESYSGYVCKIRYERLEDGSTIKRFGVKRISANITNKILTRTRNCNV